MRQTHGGGGPICLVGHLTRDIVVIEGHADTLVGGTVQYAGLTYARLGMPVSVVTRTGALDAEELTAALRMEGCSVQVFAGSHTTTFENVLSPDLRTRTQRVPSLAEPFGDEELAALSGEVIHLGPLTGREMSAPFIRAAAARSAWLVLDVQGLVRRLDGDRVVPAEWSEATELLPLCRIVKADAEEAFAVTRERKPDRAAVALNRMGAREVLVTLAEGGSYVAVSGGVRFVSAFESERGIDSTGAGDTYTAGYVFARLRGDGVHAAARFAAAVASLSTERAGPFSGALTDVERRLRR